MEDDDVTIMDYLDGGSFNGQTPDEEKRYREVRQMVLSAGGLHSRFHWWAPWW